MDREVQRLLAHADQTRAAMRDTLGDMTADEKASVIRTCAKGDLAALDERTALLVGLLAIVAIFDLTELREEA